MKDPRNPELKPDLLLHGFRVLSQAELPNLGAVLTELCHEESGARHAHISHPMTENAFVLSFRTLPEDSTGVAHILEHGVLEGSKHFPVKFFAQLTGRSLNSFLNAFTSSDTTTYPFATSDAEDWDNLLRGYLDACLHPLLLEETFLQEGWRLEFEEPENPATPLRLRGVVYNEMKAALASPESKFARRFRRELFPGSTYEHESGGDPERIPELSLAGWREFHHRHYHPGNAWSISFGHLPLAPTLKRMNESFAGLAGRGPSRLQFPDSWPQEVRRIRTGYAAVRGASRTAPRIAALGWRLGDQLDLMEGMRLRFLFEVLSGGLASPLNRALLGSGIGPSLAPVGFNSGMARMSFGTGLKQIREGGAEELEQLVLQALSAIATDGLDREVLDTALDVFELENREQSRTWGFPWSVATAWFSMEHWMSGGSLEAALRNDLLLEELRREAQDARFLPELVRTRLLENPERMLLHMEPEDGAFEARESALAARLAKKKAALGSKEAAALVDQARRVAAWRDDPGDLGCLPTLDPADRPRKARSCGLAAVDGVDHCWALPAATNGLEHVEWLLPLDISASHIQWVDLLGWVSQLSHGTLGLEASERRIRRLLGSMSLGSRHSLMADGAAVRHDLQLRFHGLTSRREQWLDLLDDLLLRTDFGNSERMQELLRMRQTNLKSQVINGAMHVVSQIAQDMVSPFGEVTSGIEGIHFMRRLAAIESGQELGQQLSSLLKQLLGGARGEFILCAGEEQLGPLGRSLNQHSSNWQGNTAAVAPHVVGRAELAVDDRLQVRTTSVDGAFHAQSWRAPAYADPDAPLLNLLGAWMQNPLYDRIRAAGGAYGARAGYDWMAGTFNFQSWRDPRIAGTLADFAAVRSLVLDGRIDHEDLDRAKIEALRRMDMPLLPHEEAYRCFHNRLLGLTDEVRGTFRERLIEAEPADLSAAAERWLDDQPRRSCVICPAAMLETEQIKWLQWEQEEILPERDA